MQITASMVKELREATSAGIMDCKKALEACMGDIEEAKKWLREKGISIATKKAGRIATEGLCSYCADKNRVILFELNSETDFVAKNEKFLSLLDTIGQALKGSNFNTLEEALNVVYNGKSVETLILESSGVIGEKISLRRVTNIVKNDSETFGIYKHMGGKIISVCVLENGSEEIAKDVCMHIACFNPKFIEKSEISKEEYDREKEICVTLTLNENKVSQKPKPESIIMEKIVPGRVDKHFDEICLYTQAFVKDPNINVATYLKGAKVKSFVRFEVGEGMEKKEDNFAQEVAMQAGLC